MFVNKPNFKDLEKKQMKENTDQQPVHGMHCHHCENKCIVEKLIAKKEGILIFQLVRKQIYKENHPRYEAGYNRG